MHFLCTIRFIKKKMKETYIETKINSSYLTPRILLAGDIHKNPGPKTNENCLICNSAVNRAQSVNCNTCKGWCHLNCSNPPDKVCLEQSFEWLCPNPTCTPNHHTGTAISIQTLPSRYNPLDSITTTTNTTRKNKTSHTKKRKTSKPQP